jgi:YesN/AraC family two-component response regulator
MPGMNGLELAITLRNRDITAPIIMLSADAKEYQSTGNTAPAYNDYLVKPVTNQNLLDKLAHHLNLNWTYQLQEAAETKANADRKPAPSPQRPNPMVIPDDPAVRELKAFAEIGYTKGVRATLQHLRDSNLIQNDTLNYFEHLTRKLQFETLVHCLELDTP